MSSQITIKDIAKALNISASTVSRALKDHPDISRETKEAVNNLAAKLRYKPNAVALSLKNSKTNTIGVIIPEVVHFFLLIGHQWNRRCGLRCRLQCNGMPVE